MIKQIIETKKCIVGLSDNGELYELMPSAKDSTGYPLGYKWSHICSSPDDTQKPYLEGEWKTRN